MEWRYRKINKFVSWGRSPDKPGCVGWVATQSNLKTGMTLRNDRRRV